ncbi:MAG: response regulator transcription factor [Elusimicrobia bacterium]|nr:response regulator transcription factor [Elusimicrobiota bacterium]
MNERVAVIDDDEDFLELLARVLGKAGYKVKTYPAPGRFLDAAAKEVPDLCLLDMQLPGMDGRDLIRVLRANPQTRRLIIVAMSAVAVSPEDAVRGLEEGADEYLRKPMELGFMLVRVRGLLDRARPPAPPPAPVLRWGALSVHPEEHRVALDGKDVPLTRLEFGLLSAFLRQPNRVLPRVWLLENVWGSSPPSGTRTVDKHVESLRRNLPAFGRRLETVVGVGYLFRP